MYVHVITGQVLSCDDIVCHVVQEEKDICYVLPTRPRPCHTFKHKFNHNVDLICVSPCGRYTLCTYDDMHCIDIYRYDKCIQTIVQPSCVFSLDISPCGQYIVSGCEGYGIIIWNYQGENLMEYHSRTGCDQITISMCGRYVVFEMCGQICVMDILIGCTNTLRNISIYAQSNIHVHGNFIILQVIEANRKNIIQYYDLKSRRLVYSVSCPYSIHILHLDCWGNYVVENTNTIIKYYPDMDLCVNCIDDTLPDTDIVDRTTCSSVCGSYLFVVIDFIYNIHYTGIIEKSKKVKKAKITRYCFDNYTHYICPSPCGKHILLLHDSNGNFKLNHMSKIEY